LLGVLCVVGCESTSEVVAVGKALCITGCENTSDVVPAGKDSYIVSGSVHGGMLGGISLVDATKKANDYCANERKVMIIRNTATAGSAMWSNEISNLVFSCVAKDDPEYQRPNLNHGYGAASTGGGQ
jgi:hypothetical protein